MSGWEESRPYGMPSFEDDWLRSPFRWGNVHGDTSRRPDSGTPLSEVLPSTQRPEPEPAKRPQAEPTVAPLSVQLTTTDGQPLADVELVVTRPGFERRVMTDADGIADLGEVDEGLYVAEPTVVPLVLPPVPAEPPQAKSGIYSRRLRRDCPSFELGTGERRQILVVRPGVTEVLVDGYAQGAKVLRWGGMRVRNDGTVGTARTALRAGLWLGRGRTMCVAGHADPLGQDSDNEALSLARAESLQLYASGQLDEWASHAFGCATELDFACAMAACNRIFGLGPLSLEDDEAIDAAHAAVRLHAGLAEEAPPGPDDWRAIADLYELDLAAMLFTDLAGLAQLRATISWTDPAVVALGERHPRPLAELTDLAGPVALAHRRTCLCVFGPQDTPQLAVDAKGDELYDGTYTRVSLQAPGEVIVDIAVDTITRDPIARGRAWIGVGNLGVNEHTAGVDGHIRFMTCKGDAIEIVAAFDSKGRGTLTAAGADK